MEEIREAAMAYYQNLLDDPKQKAHSFFGENDLNGDGRISKNEFLAMFKLLVADQDEAVKAAIDSYEKLFPELDRDCNGTIEFSEFLILYYLHLSGRLLFCNRCQAFLKALYFTCLHCFNQEGESTTTHNVCSSCYRDGRHLDHRHQNVVAFVDNYTLLLSKIGCNNTSTSKTSILKKGIFRKHRESKSEGRSRKHRRSKSEARKERFDYFVGTISLAATVGHWTHVAVQSVAAGSTAASCNIM